MIYSKFKLKAIALWTLCAIAPSVVHATTYQYLRAVPKLAVTGSSTSTSSGTSTGSGGTGTTNSTGGTGTSTASTGSADPAPAVVSTSATSIDFGYVLLGLTSTKAVVISNPGATPLDWTKLPYLTGNVGFTAETTCNVSLVQNASCLVNITYAPTIAAGGSAALQIETNAPPATVGLTGTGKSWLDTLQLSATSLNFGALQIGQSSIRTLTVTNTGTVPAPLGLASITAPYSLVGTTCASALDSGKSCDFTLQYAPASGAAANTLLPVRWGAGNEQKTVSLGGTAYQAQLNRMTYDFGNTPVGTQSAAYAIVIENTGSADLTVGTPTLAAPYAFNAQGSTCFSGPLAPQGTCYIPLTFAPTAMGAAPTGDLAVPTNAGTLHLSLTGTGASALSALSISSPSFNFGSVGVGNTATTTITLTNTSGSAQPLTVAAVAAPFALTGQSTCGATLAAGSSCNLVLTFTPSTTQAYDNTNAVPLKWGTLSEPTSIHLSGTGVDASLNMVTLSVNGDGAAVDSSALANTLTNSTATISTTTYKYGTGSMYFNGVNAHYTVASNSAFSFAQSAKDFTAEAWIRPTDLSTNRTLLSVWPQNANDEWMLGLAGNVLAFYWTPFSSGGAFITGGTVPVNQWSHVAVTRSGNTFRLFVNGTQVATGTNTGGSAAAASILDIGHYGSGAGGFSSTSWYYGYMDDIRITTGIARYTGNFTPPGAL